MKILVDAVHVFDATGLSILTRAHLIKQIDQLAAENARLRKLLDAQIRRNREISEEPSIRS